MMLDKLRSIDIARILKEERITILFQPIISISRSMVVGLEALVRGLDIETGKIISPMDLFEAAKEENLALELDRLYRRKAVEQFKKIHQTNKRLLLFIDINGSIIEDVIGSNLILDTVKENDIPFENIVLEINQLQLKDMNKLLKFISFYREHSFLISLDDVGTGLANLDRIITLEPDIIKIDRKITSDVYKDHYKQQIIKSLLSLADNTRTLVVADGIEKEAEAMMLLHLGIDMLQGIYVSHPTEIKLHKIAFLDSLVKEITLVYKNYVSKKMKKYKVNRTYIHRLLHQFCMELEKKPSSSFDEVLKEFTEAASSIECLYILNSYGIQITDTVYEDKNFHKQDSLLFSPALKGSDHSLKIYFYQLVNAEEKYFISNPYISLATGNQCITASAFFKHLDKDFILCIDFNYLEIQESY